MKIIIPFLLFFTMLTYAQPPKAKIHYFSVSQKECVKKKGYRLQLKTVVSDSRCPEGVTCVWAGEAQIVVSVYKDKKFLQDETLTLSSRHMQENAAWFTKYTGKNVAHVSLLPYPKEGIPNNLKTYYLKIGYTK
jgi:hypothetical protein